jgi:hypothetical protein
VPPPALRRGTPRAPALPDQHEPDPSERAPARPPSRATGTAPCGGCRTVWMRASARRFRGPSRLPDSSMSRRRRVSSSRRPAASRSRATAWAENASGPHSSARSRPVPSPSVTPP